MKRKKRKKIQFLRNGSDSPDFRKVILLGVIALSLMFGFLTLSWGRMISKNYNLLKIDQKTEPSPLEEKIQSLVKGYPIEKMVPYISRKDEKVAAFLIGVAKKESNWGKRVPVLDGKDCYNYWGYRSQSDQMTWDGYTCFKNPRQAVSVVSQRFNELIQDSGLDTPEKMIVWKCGWNCSGHSPESVSKWISDVDYYFQKIN